MSHRFPCARAASSARASMPKSTACARFCRGGKGLLADIETREKEKTGIRTLKIGYNKVFGYYIEVSNSFKDLVPDTYIRKQTLVNGERYITEELKDLEHEILTAGDRDKALEYEMFHRPARVRRRRARAHPARGGARRRARRALLAGVRRGEQQLLPSERGRQRRHRNSRRPPPGRRAACSRTRSSSRTTPIWASARTAPPSSPAPTWPVSRPTCVRSR